MLCTSGTFLAKLKSKPNLVKWITYLTYLICFLFLSLFPLKNSFSLITLALLAVWYPFISSVALLHGLYLSPPQLIPLPPSTLCNSSAAPYSSSFVQELAASIFCAIKCSYLRLAWELGIWRNAVVGTKCLQNFSGVPLYLESVQLLNPAVFKYLMI